CSLLHSDIYVVGADGTGYGRVTQAPACAELASYPQATVNVPIENPSFDSYFGFMYFQGASEAKVVSLPPMGHGVVTFPGVADLLPGSGEAAWRTATLIGGNGRELLFDTLVDVPPGGTVTTSEALVTFSEVPWEARTPTWTADGEGISFIYAFGSFYELPYRPPPLAFGTQLVPDGAAVPGSIDFLERGPPAGPADELPFFGLDPFVPRGVYLMEAGSSSAGEPLVPVEDLDMVKGIAWLPDASGFVYSVTEGDVFEGDYSANMYL